MLEVTFNAFTTERVFRLGQNDRADNLMAGNLRSQKRFPVWKLRVREFYELTAWTYIFPFILHLFDLALVLHGPFLRALSNPVRRLPRPPPNPPHPKADPSHSRPRSMANKKANMLHSPAVAKRPDFAKQVLSREDLAELQRRLSQMSVTAVQDFYRTA